MNRHNHPMLFATPVSAGFPSPADDYAEKPLNLDEFLVKNPASTFFVRVSGRSMTGAGILDGDVLVVDRSATPCNNKIVVAVVNGEFTVKRLRLSGSGDISLIPENPDFPAINPSDDSPAELEVWGTVVGLVRKY